MNNIIERIIYKDLPEDAKFFYRNGFEIDFVYPENNELIAIEVKKTEKDIKQIKKFKEEFKGRVKKTMIIDIEKEGTVEDVEIIPAWKFLLFFGKNK